MFSVKSYKAEMKSTEHEFYVLCKGGNSGRPSRSPNPNCFVVIATEGEKMEQLYWLSFAIWKAGRFRPLLRGSVIPFITLKDFRHVLTDVVSSAQPGVICEVAVAFQQLEAVERIAFKQIEIIGRVRSLLLQKALRF